MAITVQGRGEVDSDLSLDAGRTRHYSGWSAWMEFCWQEARMMTGQAVRVAALLSGLACAGCVDRRFVIESNVPNAQVYINDNPIGAAPAHTPFEWYGYYDITIAEPGYETITQRVHVRSPWYGFPPFDFLVEVMYPFHIRDTRRYYFELHEAIKPRPEDLVTAAEDLRRRGQNLPTPAQPAPPKQKPAPRPAQPDPAIVPGPIVPGAGPVVPGAGPFVPGAGSGVPGTPPFATPPGATPGPVPSVLPPG
jgi:PEGA domain